MDRGREKEKEMKQIPPANSMKEREREREGERERERRERERVTIESKSSLRPSDTGTSTAYMEISHAWRNWMELMQSLQGMANTGQQWCSRKRNGGMWRKHFVSRSRTTRRL